MIFSKNTTSPNKQKDLKEILKGVSRSFYLSLKFLPRRLRVPMRLAFLFCKAADTIADTKLIARSRRLEWLHQYRVLFENSDQTLSPNIEKDLAPSAENPHEKELLIKLPDLFSALSDLKINERRLINELVSELTQGMIFDLTRFPGESYEDLRALDNDRELDQYTYYVAGCVGIFWTRMLREHFDFARRWNRKTMKEIGENFGKGLQMVNILRDLPRDLKNGRCYLPLSALEQRGLAPHHLLDPEALPHAKPYLLQLTEQTRDRLACGRAYAAAHPPYALRLKWVVLLPMKLGFQTLNLLEKSDDWLNPHNVIKVRRSGVYGSMATSLFSSFPLRPSPAP